MIAKLINIKGPQRIQRLYSLSLGAKLLSRFWALCNLFSCFIFSLLTFTHASDLYRSGHFMPFPPLRLCLWAPCPSNSTPASCPFSPSVTQSTSWCFASSLASFLNLWHFYSQFWLIFNGFLNCFRYIHHSPLISRVEFTIHILYFSSIHQGTYEILCNIWLITEQPHRLPQVKTKHTYTEQKHQWALCPKNICLWI